MGHLFQPHWGDVCSVDECSEFAVVGFEARLYQDNSYLCEKHASEIMQYIETWEWHQWPPEEGEFFRNVPNDVRHFCIYATGLDSRFEYCVSCGDAKKVREHAQAA